MKEKELVTALIVNHLRWLKLMTGLERIGFDPLNYNMSLPEIIFKILDIEKSETLFLYYITASELMCVKNGNLTDSADQLYEDLVWMRQENAKKV